MQNHNNVMPLQGWILLVILSIIWGSAFMSNAVAITALPFFTIVAVRVGLGALTLYIMLKIMKIEIPTGLDKWKGLIFLGIFNCALPWCLFVWGQNYISTSLAAVLNATTPMFTVMLAHFYTDDEKLTPAKSLGILMGMLGIFVIFKPDSISLETDQLFGQISILIATFCYGIAIMIGKKFTRHKLKPMQTAFGQLLVATIIMVPLSLVVDKSYSFALPDTNVIAALVMLGVVCAAFAFPLMFKILDIGGATNASLVTFGIPIVAVTLGINVLGETFLINHGIGMGLIALSLFILDGRIFRIAKKAMA